MLKHSCLLFSVFAFCYYTDACSFKPKETNDHVLKVNPGCTISHQLNGNTALGYVWTPIVDDPEIISIESGSSNEMLTQMDPSQFNFRIKGKHKGKTRIHFQYKKPGQTNMAPRQIQVIEIEVV
jgi:predicted secreted protein